MWTTHLFARPPLPPLLLVVADVLLCLDTWRVPLVDELELVECSETTEVDFFFALAPNEVPAALRVAFAATGPFPLGSMESFNCLGFEGPACRVPLRTFCA